MRTDVLAWGDTLGDSCLTRPPAPMRRNPRNNGCLDGCVGHAFQYILNNHRGLGSERDQQVSGMVVSFPYRRRQESRHVVVNITGSEYAACADEGARCGGAPARDAGQPPLFELVYDVLLPFWRLHIDWGM